MKNQQRQPKRNPDPAADAPPRLWGMHAKMMKSYIVERSVAAIGGKRLGDLGRFDADGGREAFSRLYSERYPDSSKMSVAMQVSQLWNFLSATRVGDWVAYPYEASGGQKTVHIGRVTGEYRFDKSVRYCHQRAVKWVAVVPRDALLPVSRSSLGRPLSFFTVEGDAAADILSRVGAAEPPAGCGGDASVMTAERYVVGRLMSNLDGYGFQEFVAEALRADGYTAEVRRKGADGGVDIVAERRDGLLPVRFIVQVKRETGNVGSAELQQLRGVLPEGFMGLFVTLAGYTKAALAFARAHKSLVAVDGEGFARMVLGVYKRMSAESQRLLALDGKTFAAPTPARDCRHR